MSTFGGLLTSESVSAGHPDKICDRISDAILDAFLTRDPRARVACETFVADQRVIVAGEFRTADPAHFAAVRDEAAAIVRRTLREIGYGDAAHDIDPARCASTCCSTGSRRTSRPGPTGTTVRSAPATRA